jgi:hypothetical protein
MIEASQIMLEVNSQGGDGSVGGGMNPAIKQLGLQIKTLQNAPRDHQKLERLLRVKRRRKEEATEREDPERLVTEIEMLKVVLFLACPKIGKEEAI